MSKVFRSSFEANFKNKTKKMMLCKRITSWKKVWMRQAQVHFLIFQFQDMLDLYLNFNESQSIYAYKRCAY